MASWFVHSLIALEYAEKSELQGEEKAMLILGSIAPDFAPNRKTKKNTHYAIGIGRVTLYYGVRRCMREVGFRNITNPLEKWFYTGYLLHLRSDALWRRRCLIPSLFKMLFSPKKLRTFGWFYFTDIRKIDAYARYAYKAYNVDTQVLSALESIDPPSFFPDNLRFTEIGRAIRLFTNGQGSLSEVLKTEILAPGPIDRFFSKALELS